MNYDSRPGTREHIQRVQELLGSAQTALKAAGEAHDLSKLVYPEVSGFNEATWKLKTLKYGTPEYTAALEELKPTLDHHYAHNRHHPECHERGIHEMDLIDLLEMLADWKAAGERGKDHRGLQFSIEHNAERFGYDEQMTALLIRTAKRLGWL